MSVFDRMVTDRFKHVCINEERFVSNRINSTVIIQMSDIEIKNRTSIGYSFSTNESYSK